MTGDEIRDARQRARLTQDELGAMIGVTGRTIGNWERGHSVPRNRKPALEEALSLTTREPADPLGEVSDAALLAEIARRFERGQEARHAQASEDQSGSHPDVRAVGPGTAMRPEGNFGTRHAPGDLDSDYATDADILRMAAHKGPNRGRDDN